MQFSFVLDKTGQVCRLPGPVLLQGIALRDYWVPHVASSKEPQCGRVGALAPTDYARSQRARDISVVYAQKLNRALRVISWPFFGQMCLSHVGVTQREFYTSAWVWYAPRPRLHFVWLAPARPKGEQCGWKFLVTQDG